MVHNKIMTYQVLTTEEFDEWLAEQQA